jgi:hypothetical protein
MILAELNNKNYNLAYDIALIVNNKLQEEIREYNKSITGSNEYKQAMLDLENTDKIKNLRKAILTLDENKISCYANIGDIKEKFLKEQFSLINIDNPFNVIESKLALTNVSDVDTLVDSTLQWIKNKLEIYI